MKFGINAQVIIALLGALYILMVCREKYRVEYAEGESVAEKNSIIEEEEEAAIEGQVMIEEEGMSTGAIAGITAVSIVALIVIMIMMRRLRR